MTGFVLVPAYGRDYKSMKDLTIDFNAGKDFMMQPQGCYINKEQIVGMKLKTVQVRYSKLTKTNILKIT
jgi:hypothetical protein